MSRAIDRRLRRKSDWLEVARWFWLFILTAFLVVVAVKVWDESSSTTDSLCSLRGDLAQRVDTSARFLADHPQGIPGVPASVIRDNIANQQRTVHALRGLNC